MSSFVSYNKVFNEEQFLGSVDVSDMYFSVIEVVRPLMLLVYTFYCGITPLD